MTAAAISAAPSQLYAVSSYMRNQRRKKTTPQQSTDRQTFANASCQCYFRLENDQSPIAPALIANGQVTGAARQSVQPGSPGAMPTTNEGTSPNVVDLPGSLTTGLLTH